jgi:NADPH:quinone reductase-like Zn-dependent oxidoreductase
LPARAVFAAPPWAVTAGAAVASGARNGPVTPQGALPARAVLLAAPVAGQAGAAVPEARTSGGATTSFAYGVKIFIAGAAGAIGTHLLPQLVARGHDVVGTTRTPEKADALRALGAEPAVVDALDPDSVAEAVAKAEPEVVVHQLTALNGPPDLERAKEMAAVANPASDGRRSGKRDAEATLHLLEAERIAPSAIRHNVIAQEMVREMLAGGK